MWPARAPWRMRGGSGVGGGRRLQTPWPQQQRATNAIGCTLQAVTRVNKNTGNAVSIFCKPQNMRMVFSFLQKMKSRISLLYVLHFKCLVSLKVIQNAGQAFQFFFFFSFKEHTELIKQGDFIGDAVWSWVKSLKKNVMGYQSEGYGVQKNGEWNSLTTHVSPQPPLGPGTFPHSHTLEEPHN